MRPDLFDAHIESFVWTRVGGYDLGRRHGRGLLGGRLYSQLDLPRMREAGMTGGVFSIATNPFRSRAGRLATLLANLDRLQAALAADPGVAVVADVAGYRRARAEGRMGCFLAVQGGNAVGADDVASLPDVVSRVTLVHLTRSSLGSPARPFGGRGRGHGRGLTPAGRDYVAALDARRILVDLAHVNGPGFWDALAAHDRSTPAIVSHSRRASPGSLVRISGMLPPEFWPAPALALMHHDLLPPDDLGCGADMIAAAIAVATFEKAGREFGRIGLREALWPTISTITAPSSPARAFLIRTVRTKPSKRQ